MEALGIFLVTLPLQLLNSIGYYRLFQKANKPGWHAFVPFLNSITENDIIGRPRYEVLLEFIPFVNIYVYIRNIVELLHCFGEERTIQKTMAIIWGWIYFPIFSMRKGVKYLGTYESLPKPQKPKSVVREWVDAVTFAVIAATLIRWLIMEAYTIPTPSMENSLLVGDFLFVSKFHYGTRTPKTIVQVPLTHQKIWFTDIPSYTKWIQLPQYRLPGISHVKNGDVVVFNVPGVSENNLGVPRSEWIEYPVDLKTNYIKRCIGIPGDVIAIKDKQVSVNGQPLANPPGMQFSYTVTANDEINKRNLTNLGLDIEDYNYRGRAQDNQAVYSMFLTQEKKEEVKALPYITSVTDDDHSNEVSGGLFPQSTKYASKWTVDNFGPLTIPKKGMTIAINDSTLAYYGMTIKNYDHNDNVVIGEGTLKIDGKEVKEYTFQQDYYFMMGDNRHNSMDSRYWGFVPEDHIVGKAFFIWLSIDKYADFVHKIRWSRFFNLIR